MLLIFSNLGLYAQNKVIDAKKEIGEAAVILNGKMPIRIDKSINNANRMWEMKIDICRISENSPLSH